MDIPPKSIGDICKEKRSELGFTLAKVSELTGLSISYISDIEHGRAEPSISTLTKLGCVYKMVFYIGDV